MKSLKLVSLSFMLFSAVAVRAAGVDFSGSLRLPQPGDHTLYILTPTLLEVNRVNTRQPSPGTVDSWDWVGTNGVFAPPSLASIRVVVNGQTNNVTGTGFRRRPVYAPLAHWEIRVGNHLYLLLSTPITNGQTVTVINDGSLWPSTMTFSATADPLRFNPAIHVNEEGYVPKLPKKGMVGMYLGNLGELTVPTNRFTIVDAQTGSNVFSGTLSNRLDVGFVYLPTPYQSVMEADFSGLTNAGQYRLMVPGMGASLPFRIDEGTGMDLARTYALGMFHQRSGFNVSMPFTRFTHAADHIAPVAVPTNDLSPFNYTWNFIENYVYQTNADNPPQVAKMMTNPAAQLYPFINKGPLDVSGGHFEAADYSRNLWNGAQTVHVLMYAVDTLPGVSNIDNMGIAESGDGISDVMQEAKWEADFIAKMQDTDGGFYYMVYPRDREYEYDVLPENGDPAVVWPKNTATTAAAVAALVECASSPSFKKAYPQVATNYMAKALKGWQFLTNAIAVHGTNGAYQLIAHFDDAFADKDDLAWAACELYLATGDVQYRTKLEAWFPDPTDTATFRWYWIKMFASYGNVCRDYASAVKSGRLTAGQLNSNYLAACINVITNCGNDTLLWSQESAYGTSFPENIKHVRASGWYFSGEQAFDIMVAQQFSPNPAYVEAILANLNYEQGCNPLNVCYVTGTGWLRQREVVDQYSANDRHALPKIGVQIGNIQEGFPYTGQYGADPNQMVYPSDGVETAPYAVYDRWCDFWNVTTEASTTDDVRGFASALWLAAQTTNVQQKWTFTNATIVKVTTTNSVGHPTSVRLSVADTNLTTARITWEALGQEPTFGTTNFTFTPNTAGTNWVEAEVQWPDGRRAFATNELFVLDSPVLSDAQNLGGGSFQFTLNGAGGTTFIIQTSTNMATWSGLYTNVMPSWGTYPVIIPSSGAKQVFVRALVVP